MPDVAAGLHKNNLQLLFGESSGSFLQPRHRRFDSGIYSSRRKPKKTHCIVINLTNQQKYNETIEVNHLAARALHQGKN